ncbi:hypothetical protein U1Q18_021597 [Sarracenia purpurea var. burkii]
MSLGPWNFDKALVILDDFDGLSQPSGIKLSFSSFWLQVHDLPWISMTMQLWRLLAIKLAFLKMWTLGKETTAGANKSAIQVSLNYERLPESCFGDWKQAVLGTLLCFSMDLAACVGWKGQTREQKERMAIVVPPSPVTIRDPVLPVRSILGAR